MFKDLSYKIVRSSKDYRYIYLDMHNNVSFKKMTKIYYRIRYLS